MNEQSNPWGKYTVVLLSVWAIAAVVAGWYGIFDQREMPPLNLSLFIAIPIIGFSILYGVNAGFRAFVNSISLPLIVGAHLWRFVGLGFVVAYLLGALPAEFAYPEGLGDALAAFFALPLALALYHRKPVRRYFVAWNVFGLVDLLSAISLGVLYSNGPAGVLRDGVSTALMVTFPVSLIPTFFVPLFILLHLLALLRRKEVGAGRRVTAIGDGLVFGNEPR